MKRTFEDDVAELLRRLQRVELLATGAPEAAGAVRQALPAVRQMNDLLRTADAATVAECERQHASTVRQMLNELASARQTGTLLRTVRERIAKARRK